MIVQCSAGEVSFLLSVPNNTSKFKVTAGGKKRILFEADIYIKGFACDMKLP